MKMIKIEKNEEHNIIDHLRIHDPRLRSSKGNEGQFRCQLIANLDWLSGQSMRSYR